MCGPADGESWRDRLPQVLSDLGVGLVVGGADRALVVNEAFCTITGYSPQEALALRPFGEIFAPGERDPIARWRAGDEAVPARYDTEILHRAGRRIPVAVSAQVVWCDGRRELVATFRDLSDDRRAEAELTVRARQQEVVAEIGRRALVQRDAPSLIDAAVTAVAQTLGVDFVDVLELQPERSSLLLRAGVGWEDALVGRATVPAGRGSPAGVALDTDGPVVVADLAQEARFAVPPLLSDHGVVAGAFVVIRGEHRPYGVLATEATGPRPFSRDDVHFLRAVANVLADAIDRARAEAALRAAHDRDRRLRQRVEAYSRRVVDAQETERRRIAHELHDEIGQALTGLKMTLEEHDRLPTPAVAARLARAGELTAELLRRVQNLSLDLRPAALDDLGLRPALVCLLERYTSQTGVEVALACSGLESRLDPAVETAAYRIVQEALTNVARYAGVKKAAVGCAAEKAALRVEVADEGVGFDVDAIPIGASSGLVGMEERARSTGGHLRVWSGPGRGTTVVARLPISKPASP
ncbi:MAG: GAF domain-containing protein [Actinobacteria bacterium]|nr:GAF domain-containing protein [Actinomycetota bacterium]